LWSTVAILRTAATAAFSSTASAFRAHHGLIVREGIDVVVLFEEV
jgi:hypothetical protein